jgi:two-component system, chemotaxis family, protein-glutamate methylesterase/glutaminase
MDLTSEERTPAWLVVVGASWGGLDAVGRVLSDLPEQADCAVVAVLHRVQADSPLALLLSPRARWPLLEPEDKEPLRRGRIYVAPAGYHLMVEANHLALSTEGPFRHSRPSIDVLFESAASAWGSQVVALVLTGANSDGSEGAARVASAGGRVLVQDPAGAERREMPAAAIVAVASAEVVALADIGSRLGQMLARQSSSESSHR